MKIANVIRRFVFEEWGGTESAVWNLSKCFSAMGHSPEILATKALQPLEFEERSSVKIRRFGYFYPYLFLGKESKLALDKKGGNPFSLGIYSGIANGKFDIVHSHTLGRMAKESALAAKKLGVPCVLSFHGGYMDVPQSEIDMMKNPTKNKIGYGAAVEKIFGLRSDAVLKADGIICVGQNEYEMMRKAHPSKKVVFIPNGVDFEKFERPADADFRGRFSIPRTRRLVLCVSRIDPQKNQIALLSLLDEILKKGEDAHLALVGFVTDKTYLAKIEQAAKDLGLGDRLTVCGGIAPESPMLASAYKSADVFALASVHEPFGIVALEAWAAGTPVIAANVGGLGRLVENAKTGFLFDSSDARSMADAYFCAKKFGAETAAAAKTLCREKYSWSAAARQTLDFYNSLKK